MRSPWVWLAAALLLVGALVRVSAIPPSIADGSVAHASAYVVYDGASYTPSSVTIKKGGTVTFTSTGPLMWVATDAHPLHDGYDGVPQAQHCAPGYTGPKPFDQCIGGERFVFTFDKIGSWGYHDHLNDEAGGTVIVVE